jgi:hypothetical protein
VKRLKSISFWGWVIDLKRWKIRIKALKTVNNNSVIE